MQQSTSNTARNRIVELSADPEYRQFIIGYLLEALDERFWPLLVQTALEHGDRLAEIREGRVTRAVELREERFQ